MTAINIIEDVQPLTAFRQKAAETLKKIAETGRPSFLTVNGKIEAVVQDARSYQELMDRVSALEEETQILLGLADAEAGRGTDAREFFKKLRESVDENV